MAHGQHPPPSLCRKPTPCRLPVPQRRPRHLSHPYLALVAHPLSRLSRAVAADLDRFRQLLDITTDKGHTFEARCPAHTDNHASLSVSVGDEGGTVLHCHAGCSAEAVVAALGLSMADLAATPHVVARYAYVSPDGAVLWVIDRWAPKDFRAVPGLPVAAERVPYNLPDVIRAVKAGTTV